MDPRALGSLLSKHEIWPGGGGGGGLKPKATGLHLVSLRVDTLSRMLAPNCLLNLGRGPPNLGLYLI